MNMNPTIVLANRTTRPSIARHGRRWHKRCGYKKRLGLSPVVWKDGRIVVIPPEEIDVDESLLDLNDKRWFHVE